jgi:hypothetical protein
MNRFNQINRKAIFAKASRLNGFSLPEVLVAASAGVVLIGASTLALRSTGSLINKMDQKAALQQNTTSGKKLMRAEIERSLHLLINTNQKPTDNLAHTDIKHADYQPSLSQCNTLAEQANKVFQPIFGVKMAELNQPVFYGLSTSNTGRGYSIQRCGASMSLDGRYNEIEQQTLAMVVDNIGSIRCDSDQPECEIDEKRENFTLQEIAETTQFNFSEDKTPERTEREPAIRIMTDENRKLIRFIDPTNETDSIETSFLKVETINREITTHPLYFVAYARADKRIEGGQEEGEVLNGLFFRNVSSKRMRFLVDGSGSMSACILWGSGYGSRKIYWSGRYYFWSWRTCALTRMESLQHELISLLTDLSDDTSISIRSFSSKGYQNHRIWNDSAKGLVKLGSNGARESAIAFVNTLDDGYAYRWGGTQPWEGLDEAFADGETDTLYFLSDGEPNNNRNGGRWKSSDHDSTPDYYVNLNDKRNISLKVNTIALGSKSDWMQTLASRTTGDYLFIDKKFVMSSTQN